MALVWLAVGGIVVVLCLLGVIWRTAVAVVSRDEHTHGYSTGAAEAGASVDRKEHYAS